MRAWYERSGKRKYIEQALPTIVMSRLQSLVQKSMATVLWNSKTRVPITDNIRAEVCYLHTWLKDKSRSWEIPMGHVIPRDITIRSTGDSSRKALGAYSDDLQYWFVVYFSPDIQRRMANDDIHINATEFVTILLQIAAYITFINTPELIEPYKAQHGLPQEPVLNVQTDNQVSEVWTARVSAKSEAGQNLVRLYCQLLQLIPRTKVTASYLQGDLNTIADIISRPPDDIELTNLSLHHQQIFQTARRLRHYKYFQPSLELLSLISFLLRSKQQRAIISLPKILGQFKTDGTTGSPSVLR